MNFFFITGYATRGVAGVATRDRRIGSRLTQDFFSLVAPSVHRCLRRERSSGRRRRLPFPEIAIGRVARQALDEGIDFTNLNFGFSVKVSSSSFGQNSIPKTT
jgi:hypothetical protein